MYIHDSAETFVTIHQCSLRYLRGFDESTIVLYMYKYIILSLYPFFCYLFSSVYVNSFVNSVTSNSTSVSGCSVLFLVRDVQRLNLALFPSVHPWIELLLT